jgi:hypothetical protein
MSEHTLKYIVDEKDIDLGCVIVKNRDLVIRIEPETDTIYASIEVVVKDKSVYHIVLHPYMARIFTIKFIFFNNTRTLLINSYQILKDNYTNFKTFEIESFVPIENKKFDIKGWKKEESDYDYVMSLAEKDDSVRNVLSKCGFCL